MSRPQDIWQAEYDNDTGEHRIYDGERTLIACVGNASWPFAFQERMALAIAERGEEIRAAVDASSHRAHAMHHITSHVIEMLDAATHENGYPHDYDRSPMDYIAEMDEQSGIDGYDADSTAHRELAVIGVTKWREKNPRKASS